MENRIILSCVNSLRQVEVIGIFQSSRHVAYCHVSFKAESFGSELKKIRGNICVHDACSHNEIQSKVPNEKWAV